MINLLLATGNILGNVLGNVFSNHSIAPKNLFCNPPIDILYTFINYINFFCAHFLNSVPFILFFGGYPPLLSPLKMVYSSQFLTNLLFYDKFFLTFNMSRHILHAMRGPFASPSTLQEDLFMKQQKKICNYLKALTVVLIALVLSFFTGLTLYAFHLRETHSDSNIWSFIFFSWFIAILCILVLILFWKVCTEIGNDNSFSLENASYFHKMALLGVVALVSYVIRPVYFAISRCFDLRTLVYSVFLILICAGFSILCEALSKLIKNAYEMKLENDLTI